MTFHRSFWCTPSQLKIVGKLLEAGAKVDASNQAGLTALHAAAEEGHRAIVDKLLAAGATATLRTIKTNALAWECAEKAGHFHLIGKLRDGAVLAEEETTAQARGGRGLQQLRAMRARRARNEAKALEAVFWQRRRQVEEATRDFDPETGSMFWHKASDE